MLDLMNPVGLRLEADRRRVQLHQAMRGSRLGTLRRPVGSWLLGLGAQLAPETRLRPVQDCP